ncbi:unnamed protein product, partial [Effrenium voratum]
VISFNGSISACEACGEPWPMALQLVAALHKAQLDATGVTFSSAISACEKGERWNWVLRFLEGWLLSRARPDEITCRAVISACIKSDWWEQALINLGAMREASLAKFLDLTG